MQPRREQMACNDGRRFLSLLREEKNLRYYMGTPCVACYDDIIVSDMCTVLAEEGREHIGKNLYFDLITGTIVIHL